MSRESALAFYERLENDPDLTERLRALAAPEAERLVKEELGYEFTKEEIQHVIFERNPEMTDAELEAVVGSGSASNVIWGIVGALVGAAAAAA